ncbi:MAG: segregation and condensation protein A [Acidimicrobiales bacterium]
MGYKVHTDVFEGPFDLLLRLITEQRVDLYEVALADIVDAFLAEVEAMQRLDLEVATEFLVIAATLVELKCRRLLPGRDEPDEEGLALLEERDYLLARLVECTTFSAAGAQLASAELAASRSWPRLAGLDERFEGLQPDLLAYLSPEDVRAAALRALAPRPTPRVEVDHVLVDEVTVAEVVEALCASLPGSSPTSFRALTMAADTRMEVVVHFLGLLELYKQGLVELEQATTFGELRVLWTGGLFGATPEAGDGRDALEEFGWRQPASVSLADLDYRG